MGKGQITRRGALAGLGAGALALGGWTYLRRRRRAQVGALYNERPGPPQGALNVYHLGHSLVGRDMPAMLSQMAGNGHGYASQLGWGASLKDHWEPDIPVNGFAEENAHSAHRPAHDAMQSGAYDAVVLTEMISLDDAIRYHDSAKHLANWAAAARAGNSAARVYLYETWHHTNDPQGWDARLALDIEALWTRELALPAAARAGTAIWIIPAGQVLAGYLATRTDEMPDRDALFARTPEGEVDTIHLGDLGNYLVALTHYAVLYQKRPSGLPVALLRADGSPAAAPDAETALHMQKLAWSIPQNFYLSGMPV